MTRSAFASGGTQEHLTRPVATAGGHERGVFVRGEADAEDSGSGLAFGERWASDARVHKSSIAATETLDNRDLGGYDKPMTTQTQTGPVVKIDHRCWCGEKARYHQSFADGFDYVGMVCVNHVNENRRGR
jgi:hypothetical protein